MPEGYLVTIVPFPEIGVTGSNVDVDDVDWPWPGPIEQAGQPMLSEDGESIDRCLRIDRATGAVLLAAEAAAGRRPEPGALAEHRRLRLAARQRLGGRLAAAPAPAPGRIMRGDRGRGAVAAGWTR